MAVSDFSEIRTTASSRNFHNTHNGVKTMAIIERTNGKETNADIDEVLISSDSHVIEPEGLWKKQLPKAFQDRAPGFGGQRTTDSPGAMDKTTHVADIAADRVNAELTY